MTWTQTELKKILRRVRLEMKGSDASDAYVRGWRHAIREIEWAIQAQMDKEQERETAMLERAQQRH